METISKHHQDRDNAINLRIENFMATFKTPIFLTTNTPNTSV